MWFIGVEVEQETSAPPPKKNPGSAPELFPGKYQTTASPNYIIIIVITRTGFCPERISKIIIWNVH